MFTFWSKSDATIDSQTGREITNSIENAMGDDESDKTDIISVSSADQQHESVQQEQVAEKQPEQTTRLDHPIEQVVVTPPTPKSAPVSASEPNLPAKRFHNFTGASYPLPKVRRRCFSADGKSRTVHFESGTYCPPRRTYPIPDIVEPKGAYHVDMSHIAGISNGAGAGAGAGANADSQSIRNRQCDCCFTVCDCLREAYSCVAETVTEVCDVVERDLHQAWTEISPYLARWFPCLR